MKAKRRQAAEERKAAKRVALKENRHSKYYRKQRQAAQGGHTMSSPLRSVVVNIDDDGETR